MTNKVNYNNRNVCKDVVDLSTDDLRSQHIKQGHTAFVGSLWENEGSELYLVSYSSVILASDPHTTWNACNTWLVNRWVDVEIVVLN